MINTRDLYRKAWRVMRLQASHSWNVEHMWFIDEAQYSHYLREAVPFDGWDQFHRYEREQFMKLRDLRGFKPYRPDYDDIPF